jgi:hypothetical protein
MFCKACDKDTNVIVVAQVIVSLPVLVHSNHAKVKMHERAQIDAKVPERGICAECGAEMVNPIRDLQEWKKFLTPEVLHEDNEQRISKV